MDFIFDDEAEEVGSEVEAYCPKCKADTTHVVMSKYEDEIRRVQCNPCGDVHAFRKPRGESEDDVPEPIAAKKRAAKAKPTWDQVMAKSKKEPRLYMVADRYSENELVSHPIFGVGFVSEVMGDNKIEITFQNERRVLVHNRKGMSLPPSAYAHAVDATAKKDRRKEAVKQAAVKSGEAKAKKAAEKDKTAKPEKAVAKPAAKPAAKPIRAAKASAKPAAKAAKPVKAAAKPALKKPAKAPKPVKKAAARPAQKAKAAKPAPKAKPAAKKAAKKR